MATVTVIPAKPMQELKGLEATAKLRVCAYARVSTDNEEQLSSYQAQVEHYTSYIKNNPAWKFVEVYSDEGISGTNTKKREGFNRMIDDCMASKIDMVITKSISRFARNTLDTLKYVRQLKEKGVAIFFEKENVNTLDSKGEFLITLLGSLAQEESSNLSQITKMGISYRFQEGKVLVNHNKFLGYTKNEDRELVIEPKEAEVVRRIYREFLEGKSPYKIASNLQRDGILTGAGGSRWYDSTVIKILKNEKYNGDALLQKTYTIDFLTKRRVKNTGHAAQFTLRIFTKLLLVRKSSQRYRWNLKDVQTCGAIPRVVRVLLLVNILFQGSYFVKIVVRSSDAKLGGVAKTESTYGGVLTEKSMGWNLAV